jgi:hypothetical protein
MVFDAVEVRRIISRKDDILIADGNKMKWKNSGNSFYKKACFTQG